MNVFVINLDRCPERLEHMQRQLDRENLALNRIAAIDGHKLPDSEYDNWTKAPPDYPKLNKPALACFLSHRLAWQRFLSSHETSAVILEDDVWLSEGAGKIMNRLADFSYSEPTLLKLETMSLTMKIRVNRSFTAINGTNSRIHALKDAHAGTAGYWLNRDAAKHLLALEFISYPLDFEMFHPDKSRVFSTLIVKQLVPAICIQDVILPKHRRVGFKTNIGGEDRENIANKKIKLKKPFIEKIRREALRLNNHAFLISMKIINKNRFVYKIIPFE